MTKEEIIEMARQAGLDPDLWNYTDAFERFAVLVAEHERDECGKICYVEFHKPIEVLIKDISTYENGWIEGCKTCFEKIYARGQK